MKKVLFLVLAPLLGLSIGFALQGDGQAEAQAPPRMHGRGHITPKNIAELHAKSWARHGKRLQALPKVTAPKWDCRSLGIVGPIQDQGQCGSCWDVSACGVIDSALIKAGYAKPDGSLTVSAQYILDCTSNGGCNGDDASTVTLWARDHGIPSAQDYGAYTANPGRCHSDSSMKLYRIDMQGYCSQQDGIAPVQSIKDAIVAYGPISSAVDAGGFNGYSSGVMHGDGRNVDHDVSIAGWDDNYQSSGIGCWLVKNQWGADWGDHGYCWIPYGKWSIGTSALFVHAIPAVPPPTPPTPGPTPPPPAPGPTPPPAPTPQTFTVTIPAYVVPAMNVSGIGNHVLPAFQIPERTVTGTINAAKGFSFNVTAGTVTVDRVILGGVDLGKQLADIQAATVKTK